MQDAPDKGGRTGKAARKIAERAAQRAYKSVNVLPH
jgi:hypothetical protein